MVAKLKQLSLPVTTALFMAFGILLLVSGDLVFALNQTGKVNSSGIIPQGNHPSFVYDSLGKPDPFRPFIDFNAIERPIPTKEPKTPLERYSLNQFKLVGILIASRKRFAMIEDPEQIGYTITEGNKLGNLSGIVEEIKENEIIIAEPYLDIYDREQIRKISLKLHVKEDQGGK